MTEKFDYSDELALAAQLMRADASRSSRMTPVFLHFSDVHNHTERFSAIMEFYNEHRDIITDIIHTGDCVNDRFKEGLTPEVKQYFEYVYNVIGNHDMLASDAWDWSMKVDQVTLYDTFFKDRAEGRELVIEEGKTYWYKDLDKWELRLIGLNSCLKDDEQLVWLENALAGALEKGYAVIIPEHYPPSNARAVKCGFSSVMLPAEKLGVGFPEKLQAAVDAFKKSGGEFICYLCGHTHADYIAYNENYPDQLFITVDAAHYGHANYWSDTYRKPGTKSLDLFNLFSYDTVNKLIKIVRIGANADCLLRSKRSLCVNYLTGEVVSQS